MSQADRIWLKVSLLSAKLFWVFILGSFTIFGGSMFELRRAFSATQLLTLIGSCFLLGVLFYSLFISGFICLGFPLYVPAAILKTRLLRRAFAELPSVVPQ